MEFLSHYATFFAETFTTVAAIIIILIAFFALLGKSKSRQKGKIIVKNLNEKFKTLTESIQKELLDKKAFKAFIKSVKKESKEAQGEYRKRLFVIDFKSSIKATQVENLRREVSAILSIATPEDEVLLRLESGGGVVTGYGFGASQLQRIRDANIPLTVCVDKVAASGGYMMACIGNQILAAPFSVVGSIGVVAQIPNFHRLLKKHNVDFEQITAGEYKRTLTLFGENTNKAREKFQEDMEVIHTLFKDFIAIHRPQVNLDKTATGEHWLAKKAIELNLVDKLMTSDEYLMQSLETKDIYKIQYKFPKSMVEKFQTSAASIVERVMETFRQTDQDSALF